MTGGNVHLHLLFFCSHFFLLRFEGFSADSGPNSNKLAVKLVAAIHLVKDRPSSYLWVNRYLDALPSGTKLYNEVIQFDTAQMKAQISMVKSISATVLMVMRT